MTARRSSIFTIAPAVRIMASDHGVRASVGSAPGAARIAFGTHGTYTSATVDGVRVSRRHAPGATAGRLTGSRAALAQLERVYARAESEASIDTLAAIETALVTLHHESFPIARMPSVEVPDPADRAELHLQYERAATRGLGRLQLGRRRAAKLVAVQSAEAEGDRLDAENISAYESLVAEISAKWRRFLHHDPTLVIEALESAFADHHPTATCIDAGRDAGIAYATVAIVWGPAGMIPDRTPTVTPTGTRTKKARNRTNRNALYVDALGSAVLATVKEGLAVVPSMQEVRIVVVRRDPSADNPAEFVTAIFAGRFTRARFTKRDWATIKPTEALLSADGSRLQRRGLAGEVAAIDLADDTDLADLVATLGQALA